MTTARAGIEIPDRTIAAAEALWYDTTRWASFVDGLQHVHAVEGDHPHAGSAVKWSSFPGGRGRVLERVVSFEPGAGQVSDVQDTQIRGRQTLRFEAVEGGAVRVGLELEYEIKQRSIITPLVDLLFVRRAQGDSLRRTLMRFARELDAEPRG
jgi:hypothetical protein